jgi:hypothetical protein
MQALPADLLCHAVTAATFPRIRQLCRNYLYLLHISKDVAAAFDYIAYVLAARVQITSTDMYGRVQFTCTIPASAAVITADSRRAINVLASADNVLVCCIFHEYPELADICALPGIHAADLSYCDAMADVSALGGVHTLSIAHCAAVTDVSALGRVHELDLSGCRGVTDVSALSSVHTLVR